MNKSPRSSSLTCEDLGIDLVPGLTTKEAAAQYVKNTFDQHPIYKRYYCDDYGNAYHITCTGKAAIKLRTKAMNGKDEKYSYPVICVYDDDKKPYMILLHRFCFECRYGSIPEGYVIHHQDEDKKNSSLNNITLEKAIDHNIYHHNGRKYRK